MEKFYDILDKEEGKLAVCEYLKRILVLRDRKEKSPIDKVKAEILIGEIFFGTEDPQVASKDHIVKYLALDDNDRRKVDMTIRDLVDHYKVEDMIKVASLDVSEGANADINELIDKVLNDYIEFRTTLDTVSPEDSAEIEKILEMSDEEYEAYQEAQDAALENQLEEASGEYQEDIGGDSESD